MALLFLEKKFGNFWRIFKKLSKNLKVLMKFLEKIKKNLNKFWKNFLECRLLWKLVPAFGIFPGFGGGGRSPGSPPWSRYWDTVSMKKYSILSQTNGRGWNWWNVAPQTPKNLKRAKSPFAATSRDSRNQKKFIFLLSYLLYFIKLSKIFKVFFKNFKKFLIKI